LLRRFHELRWFISGDEIAGAAQAHPGGDHLIRYPCDGR
jgi:hypothetical protein